MNTSTKPKTVTKPQSVAMAALRKLPQNPLLPGVDEALRQVALPGYN